MKKRLNFVLGVLVPVLLFAFDDAKLKPITVIGTVVDTGCYIVHDGIGADHAECAMECAKKGIPLAILDQTGKLYLPLGVDHENQNTRLMPFVEKKVKVIGTQVDRGGLSGISIKTIEAVK
jgi:hypothetical protein